MKKFPAKTSNKEVATTIVLEHLRSAELPILTMDQAFALVTETTKSLHRHCIRNDEIAIEPRKYRKDFFPNNFLNHKQIAVILTHDGSYMFYLKEAAKHPTNRKVISLFERQPQEARMLPEFLPRQAAIGR